MKQLHCYKPQSEMKWSYRLVAWSIALTFALFVFIPVMEKLFNDHNKIKIRTIESIDILKQPPKLPPRKKESLEKSKPKLNQNRQPLSLMQIQAALDVSPGEGDFTLDFGMRGLQGGNDLVFELSEVEQPAKAVYRVAPIYPMAAKMKKITGKVIVEFVVTIEGKTEKIKIISATPEGVFERSVVQAIKKWKFKPSMLHDKPVASRMLQPLEFNLD